MGRFMYVHFGDDVPRKIEAEYNKLLRREQYLKERDAENGVIDIVDFDEVLELNPDPASLPINEYEVEEKRIHDRRLDYLPVAMELLRAEFPEGYALIVDYFYSDKKVSLMYLANKYGMTIDAVRYRMDQAKARLKEYIIMHENE